MLDSIVYGGKKDSERVRRKIADWLAEECLVYQCVTVGADRIVGTRIRESILQIHKLQPNDSLRWYEPEWGAEFFCE